MIVLVYGILLLFYCVIFVFSSVQLLSFSENLGMSHNKPGFSCLKNAVVFSSGKPGLETVAMILITACCHMV